MMQHINLNALLWMAEMMEESSLLSSSEGTYLNMIKNAFSFRKQEYIVSKSLNFLNKVSFGSLYDLIPYCSHPYPKSVPGPQPLRYSCKHAKSTDTPEPLFFLLSSLDALPSSIPLACLLASFRSLLKCNLREGAPNHPN